MQVGKGDKRRPTMINKDKFEHNWNRIFKDKERGKKIVPDRNKTKTRPE